MSFLILKQILSLQLLSFGHNYKALGPIFQMKTFPLLDWVIYFFSRVYGGKGMGVVGSLGSPVFPFLILPPLPFFSGNLSLLPKSGLSRKQDWKTRKGLLDGDCHDMALMQSGLDPAQIPSALQESLLVQNNSRPTPSTIHLLRKHSRSKAAHSALLSWAADQPQSCLLAFECGTSTSLCTSHTMVGREVAKDVMALNQLLLKKLLQNQSGFFGTSTLERPQISLDCLPFLPRPVRFLHEGLPSYPEYKVIRILSTCFSSSFESSTKTEEERVLLSPPHYTNTTLHSLALLYPLLCKFNLDVRFLQTALSSQPLVYPTISPHWISHLCKYPALFFAQPIAMVSIFSSLLFFL